MKIDKSIRSGNEKTDAYIAELESELTSFEASNTKRLIQNIDLLAGVIADHIADMATGVTDDEGKAKEVDKNLVDAYIKMVDKTDKITLFADSVKAMNLEVINEPKKATDEPEKEPIIKEGENAFEEVMKRIKAKKK